MATKEDEAVTAALIEQMTSKRPATTTPVPKEEEKLFNEEWEDEALPNSVRYSELFGGLPKGKKDFFISVYKATDWPEEDREYIPEDAKHHVIDHDVVYPFVLAIKNNMNTLLVGPTGSGKTSLCRLVAARLGMPYLRINGRQDMESDSLIGKPWVSNGSMEYMLGELPKARQKGWFIAFDEPWKTPAGIQMTLQRMYERNGILQLDDMPGSLKSKQIVPHERSRMVLCDNVVGTGDGVDKYASTLIQDSATLNRMEMVLKVDYLKEKDEVDLIVSKHAYIPKKQARYMVKLAQLIRQAFTSGDVSSVMSPRQLETWATIAHILGDYKQAFDYVMRERFPTDSEKATVQNFWTTVYKA